MSILFSLKCNGNSCPQLNVSMVVYCCRFESRFKSTFFFIRGIKSGKSVNVTDHSPTGRYRESNLEQKIPPTPVPEPNSSI